MDTNEKPDGYRGGGERMQWRQTSPPKAKELTMNRYSLSSESDRWWYTSAIAGTLGAAAVTAIFAVPVIGAQATPIETPTERSGPVILVDRPCYMARAGWNTPAGWEQPVCTTEVGGRSGGAATGSRRVAPDYLP